MLRPFAGNACVVVPAVLRVRFGVPRMLARGRPATSNF